MHLDYLRPLWQAAPFRPFTLHLADGRALTVQHPELMARIGEGRHVIVTHEDSAGFEIVDLLLVTSIEQRDAAKDRGNGQN